MGARARQQCLIFRIGRVQRDHVRDRQARFAAPKTLNRIPRAYVAFSRDSEIEPIAPTFQKTPDHVGVPETEREFVARDSWLCNNEFRRTYPVAVANPDVFFQQALRSEILAERTPGQFRIWEFATPKIVVLHWIGVYGLLRTAVNGQIRLLVSVDVVMRDICAAGYRR